MPSSASKSNVNATAKPLPSGHMADRSTGPSWRSGSPRATGAGPTRCGELPRGDGHLVPCDGIPAVPSIAAGPGPNIQEMTRILVIDDEPAIADVLRMLLE